MKEKSLRYIIITVIVFILLSIISLYMSGAPLKVHAIDISALFIAFVIPNIVSYKKDIKKSFYIWLLGSIIGIFYWDVLTSYAIVKKEIFMWWYIIYPVCILSIMLLQIIIKYINRLK